MTYFKTLLGVFSLSMLLSACISNHSKDTDLLPFGVFPETKQPEIQSSPQLPSDYVEQATVSTPPVFERAIQSHFELKSSRAVNPLPDARIPSLQLESAMLSDALVQILKNVDMNLSVADDITDKRLINVSLPGTFDKAIERLSIEADFIYSLKNKTLRISKTDSMTLLLPKLGLQNETSKAEDYSFIRSDLVSILDQEPIFDAKKPAFTFDATADKIQQVKDYLDAYKAEKKLVKLKLNLLLTDGQRPIPSKAVFSEDQNFAVLSSIAINKERVKDLLAQHYQDSQSFDVQGILGQPMMFDLLCKTGKQQFTIQPILENNQIQYRIFNQACNGKKDSLTVTEDYGYNYTMFLPNGQWLVMEPTILKF